MWIFVFANFTLLKNFILIISVWMQTKGKHYKRKLCYFLSCIITSKANKIQ